MNVHKYYKDHFPEYFKNDDIEYFNNCKNDLATEFVKGLVWVLRYYYRGCCSWKWYFPSFYAPLASDIANLAAICL